MPAQTFPRATVSRTRDTTVDCLLSLARATKRGAMTTANNFKLIGIKPAQFGGSSTHHYLLGTMTAYYRAAAITWASSELLTVDYDLWHSIDCAIQDDATSASNELNFAFGNYLRGDS